MKIHPMTWRKFYEDGVGLTMAVIVSAGFCFVLGHSIWQAL